MRQKSEIHPIDTYAGNKLREARKFRGLSQETLGRELPEKVTFQQIQKYERGANRIAISRMYEFLQVLKLPMDYFLPADVLRLPADATSSGPLITDREAVLLKDFRKLPTQSQAAVTALLHTLAGK